MVPVVVARVVTCIAVTTVGEAMEVTAVCLHVGTTASTHITPAAAPMAATVRAAVSMEATDRVVVPAVVA